MNKRRFFRGDRLFWCLRLKLMPVLNDLEKGRTAADAIGDDHIQPEATGSTGPKLGRTGRPNSGSSDPAAGPTQTTPTGATPSRAASDARTFRGDRGRGMLTAWTQPTR